jgi:hypothetical protein
VDAEQIQREMKATRAPIDWKLDALAARMASAKKDAIGGVIAAMTAVDALAGVSWWRRRTHA